MDKFNCYVIVVFNNLRQTCHVKIQILITQHKILKKEAIKSLKLLPIAISILYAA